MFLTQPEGTLLWLAAAATLTPAVVHPLEFERSVEDSAVTVSPESFVRTIAVRLRVFVAVEATGGWIVSLGVLAPKAYFRSGE
jgi:hypothetical protein